MPTKLKDIERLKKTKCRTQKERIEIQLEQADIYAYCKHVLLDEFY